MLKTILEAPVKREFVYGVIDDERDYQDALGPDPRPTHTTGEYLTMLDPYLRKAQDAWTSNAGDTEALHEVRKIAAIAVHCMEDNGAPQREWARK